MSSLGAQEEIVYDTVDSMVDTLQGEGEDGAERGPHRQDHQILEDLYAREVEAVAANRHRPRRADVADVAVVRIRPSEPSGPLNHDPTIPRRRREDRVRREYGRRMRLEHQHMLCVCCGRVSVLYQTYIADRRQNVGMPALFTNDLEFKWSNCIHCLVDEAVVGSLMNRAVEKDVNKADEGVSAEKGNEKDQKDASAPKR